MNTPDLETAINTTQVPRFEAADTTYASQQEARENYTFSNTAFLEEHPLYAVLHQESPLYGFLEQTKPYEIALDMMPDGSYSIRMSYLEPMMDAMMPYGDKRQGNAYDEETRRYNH